jgi:hypothetical protein
MTVILIHTGILTSHITTWGRSSDGRALA